MEAVLPASAPEVTRARLGTSTRQLVEQMRELSPKKLAALMSMSAKLTEVNANRWRDFGARGNPRGPAALCFNGDVYQGLDAPSMKPAALKWAQERLRILSGLYGLLRPLDQIQPYRLEMGTRLATTAGKDLYQFWGDKVSDLLARDVARAKPNALVNLASDEYSKAGKLKTLGIPVINVKFLQVTAGKARFLSFYGKRARGLMARWLADQRPGKPADLADFDVEGYRFQPKESSDSTLVFSRPKPAPVSASAR